MVELKEEEAAAVGGGSSPPTAQEFKNSEPEAEDIQR
jgi:hypothetical protein